MTPQVRHVNCYTQPDFFFRYGRRPSLWTPKHVFLKFQIFVPRETHRRATKETMQFFIEAPERSVMSLAEKPTPSFERIHHQWITPKIWRFVLSCPRPREKREVFPHKDTLLRFLDERKSQEIHYSRRPHLKDLFYRVLALFSFFPNISRGNYSENRRNFVWNFRSLSHHSRHWQSRRKTSLVGSLPLFEHFFHAEKFGESESSTRLSFVHSECTSSCRKNKVMRRWRNGERI